MIWSWSFGRVLVCIEPKENGEPIRLNSMVWCRLRRVRLRKISVNATELRKEENKSIRMLLRSVKIRFSWIRITKPEFGRHPVVTWLQFKLKNAVTHSSEAIRWCNVINEALSRDVCSCEVRDSKTADKSFIRSLCLNVRLRSSPSTGTTQHTHGHQSPNRIGIAIGKD